jgi:putative endonuclease
VTRARLRTGRIGEDRACEFLGRRGFAILARNCRTRFGEIDAIALDRGALVFVEVKTMRQSSRSGPEQPILAVGRRKQIQIRRLARSWLAENTTPRHRSLRFDVVGVSLDSADRPVAIEHVADAF